jgi:hypothetical protein
LSEEEREKVSSHLSQIKYAAEGMDADRDALYKESVSRKEKLRDLESDIDKLRSEKEELENTDKVQELQSEIEKLQTFREQVYNEKRGQYKSKLKSIMEHDKFDKIKDKIAVPDKKNEDDELIFDELENEQVEQSLEKIQEWEDLGIFETKKNNKRKIPASHTPTTDTDFENVDPEKLAREDPESYKRLRKQKGFE